MVVPELGCSTRAAPRRRRCSAVWAWAAAGGLWVAPCAGGGAESSSSAGAPVVSFTVSQKFPHRTDCFTEGLFVHGSKGTEIFESCGLYAKSYLRRYDLHSGNTLKTVKVPEEFFSEGVALMGRALYMLTYKAHQILEYDADTFKEVRRHPFPYGEGWGLTMDGCDLLATTGSPFIFRLRLGAGGTLELVSKVQVMHNNLPLKNLNEIEYVTPKVWINQWLTNVLWRVDPVTGVAEAQMSVQSLHRWQGEATPNGVAYNMALGENALLVTGKLWPQMFLVQLSPNDLCGGSVAAAPSCAAAPDSACFRRASFAATSAQRPELPPPAASAAPAPAPAPPVAAPVAAAPMTATATTAAAGPSQSAAAASAVAEAVQEVAMPVEAPPALKDRAKIVPLPGPVVAAAAGASLVLAAAAVLVPWRAAAWRHRYVGVRERDRSCDVY